MSRGPTNKRGSSPHQISLPSPPESNEWQSTRRILRRKVVHSSSIKTSNENIQVGIVTEEPPQYIIPNDNQLIAKSVHDVIGSGIIDSGSGERRLDRRQLTQMWNRAHRKDELGLVKLPLPYSNYEDSTVRSEMGVGTELEENEGEPVKIQIPKESLLHFKGGRKWGVQKLQLFNKYILEGAGSLQSHQKGKISKGTKNLSRHHHHHHHHHGISEKEIGNIDIGGDISEALRKMHIEGPCLHRSWHRKSANPTIERMKSVRTRRQKKGEGSAGELSSSVRSSRRCLGGAHADRMTTSTFIEEGRLRGGTGGGLQEDDRDRGRDRDKDTIHKDRIHKDTLVHNARNQSVGELGSGIELESKFLHASYQSPRFPRYIPDSPQHPPPATNPHIGQQTRHPASTIATTHLQLRNSGTPHNQNKNKYNTPPRNMSANTSSRPQYLRHYFSYEKSYKDTNTTTPQFTNPLLITHVNSIGVGSDEKLNLLEDKVNQQEVRRKISHLNHKICSIKESPALVSPRQLQHIIGQSLSKVMMSNREMGLINSKNKMVLMEPPLGNLNKYAKLSQRRKHSTIFNTFYNARTNANAKLNSTLPL